MAYLVLSRHAQCPIHYGQSVVQSIISLRRRITHFMHKHENITVRLYVSVRESSAYLSIVTVSW